MLGCPPFPVPPSWFPDFLTLTKLSAPAVAAILKMPDDRKARRWKKGQEIPPWGVCELLAAWHDGRPPILEKHQ